MIDVVPDVLHMTIRLVSHLLTKLIEDVVGLKDDEVEKSLFEELQNFGWVIRIGCVQLF